MLCMLQTCKCSTVGLWNHLLFIDSVLALFSLSWPDFVWHSCTLCQKLLALKCEEPLKIITVFPKSIQGVQPQTKTEDIERNLFQEGGGEEKDRQGLGEVKQAGRDWERGQDDPHLVFIYQYSSSNANFMFWIFKK